MRYAWRVCLMRNWTGVPTASAAAQNPDEAVLVVSRVLATDRHESV